MKHGNKLSMDLERSIPLLCNRITESLTGEHQNNITLEMFLKATKGNKILRELLCPSNI